MPEAFVNLFDKDIDYSSRDLNEPFVIGNITLGVCRRVACLMRDEGIADPNIGFQLPSPTVILTESAYEKVIKAIKENRDDIYVDFVMIDEYGKQVISKLNAKKLLLLN